MAAERGPKPAWRCEECGRALADDDPNVPTTDAAELAALLCQECEFDGLGCYQADDGASA